MATSAGADGAEPLGGGVADGLGRTEGLAVGLGLTEGLDGAAALAAGAADPLEVQAVPTRASRVPAARATRRRGRDGLVGARLLVVTGFLRTSEALLGEP